MNTLDQEYEMEEEPGPGLGRGGYRSVGSSGSVAATPPVAAPQDLTLGMTALFGIFLAVVLVCAVFFGFGYSTGRTWHGPKTAAATPAAGNAPTASSPSDSSENVSGPGTSPSLAAVQPASKPSAGAPLSDAGSGQSAASEQEGLSSPATTRTAPEARSAFGAEIPQQASTMPPAAQRIAPQSASVDAVPSGALPANTSGNALSTGTFMVQIAAVARPAEAEMLARALRTNGYAAVVRTEPRDSFLHVQVGPFATRDAARAMRARLQGSGYNAFLKP